MVKTRSRTTERSINRRNYKKNITNNSFQRKFQLVHKNLKKSSAKKQNDVEKEYLLRVVFLISTTNSSILDKLKSLEFEEQEREFIYNEKPVHHAEFCHCFHCQDGKHWRITMENFFDTKGEYLICKREVKKIFSRQKYTFKRCSTEVHLNNKKEVLCHQFVFEMNYDMIFI
jgi:hypothetical protein